MNSPLSLRRLNMDTSWQLSWGATSLLIDPWLVGSEVDGWAWFNEQWHTTAPLACESLAPFDAILVSQSYSDHCHENTLNLLASVPLLATPKAVKRLAKTYSKPTLPLVQLGKGWVPLGELELAYLDPGNTRDPVYYGIVIRRGDDAVVYLPHGFELDAHQRQLLQPLRICLLMTSFSTYRLPRLLGGAVNPGESNALALVQQLQPAQVVATHDERKQGRGLVRMLAQTQYPTAAELAAQLGARYVNLDSHYEVHRYSPGA